MDNSISDYVCQFIFVQQYPTFEKKKRQRESFVCEMNHVNSFIKQVNHSYFTWLFSKVACCQHVSDDREMLVKYTDPKKRVYLKLGDSCENISMGESNTVVSVYTLYSHLQQYCSHPSISCGTK